MTTPTNVEAQATHPPAADPAGSGLSVNAENGHATSAIFVAHGMGQQIRFETLAQIAEGLRAEDANYGYDTRANPYKAVSIEADDKQLHGIQINLANGHAVDIFEGYWAPLTEGKITLRDVISFLKKGGLNGCKHATRPFTRFLFNNHCTYHTRPTVLLALLAALLVVISLVTMNSVIALVTGGYSLSLFSLTKGVSHEFITSLTTVFDLFLGVALFYLCGLAVSYIFRHPGLSPRARAVIGKVTKLLFAALALATIMSGLTIAYLSYKYPSPGNQGSAFEDVLTFLGPGFNWWCGVVLLSLGAVFALPGLGYFIYLYLRQMTAASSRQRPEKKRGAAFVLLCSLLLVGAIYLVTTRVMAPNLPPQQGSTLNWVALTPWALLVVISEKVRRLLVQYVGDVAIYVAPYSLDRFYLLRNEIRDTVTDAAKVVFGALRPNLANQAKPATGDFKYQQVFVIGHSLGSVIAYDALNKLLCDDIADGKSLNVIGRTKLLLTFGSPLDKIAFLFARPDNKLCYARDVAQSSAQPLIGDPKFRQLDWVNIFSPLDIISGELNFFDPPEQKQAEPTTFSHKPVFNLTDPQATIYLAAHVEYWNNDLLFKILRSAIVSNRRRLGELIKENWVKKDVELGRWFS